MTRWQIPLMLAIAVCAWVIVPSAASAATSPDVTVRIAAAQEGPDGLATVIRLAVSCPSGLHRVGLAAWVAQSQPSGKIASASQTSNATCTGQPRPVTLTFGSCQSGFDSCVQFRAAPARITVDISDQQGFLLRHKEVMSAVTAVRSATVLVPSPYLSPSLSGRLVAGGAGVTTDLTFRCPKPSNIELDAGLMEATSGQQPLVGYGLIHGLPPIAHCDTGTRTVHLTFTSAPGTSPPWHSGLALLGVSLTFEYPHSTIYAESHAVVRLR